MAKTKVLVIYNSVGNGIAMTGHNVAEQLEKSGRYEVRQQNLEEIEDNASGNLFRSTYVWLSDHTPFWGYLYSSKPINFVFLRMRKFLASFKYKRVLGILREFQPAIVISTGGVPSGIVAYIKSKGLYRGKLVSVFSDYHLHPFWVHEEADLFICNIPDQMDGLRQMGYDESRMRLTGTIIADKFFREIDSEDAKSQLGLLKSMPVVLLGGAGRTRATNKEIFLQMLRSTKSFQVVVLCGRNETLKEELLKISAPDRHPVKILGFMDNMEVLMSAASVLVYKTGGPTMAEAVVKHLPMVLTDVRPGHEMINLNYLLKHNIAQYARIPREAVVMVEQALSGRSHLNFQASFNTIIKPAGSVSVVEAVDSINPESGDVQVKNYQENELTGAVQ